MAECNFCSWDRGKIYKIDPECPIHGDNHVNLTYTPKPKEKPPAKAEGETQGREKS